MVEGGAVAHKLHAVHCVSSVRPCVDGDFAGRRTAVRLQAAWVSGPIDPGTAHDMDSARRVHLSGPRRPSWVCRSPYTSPLEIHAHHMSLTRGVDGACDASNGNYEA